MPEKRHVFVGSKKATALLAEVRIAAKQNDESIRVTDVASSATAMRGKQELQEIFAALQGRITPVVTVVSKDGLAFAHIRMKEKMEVDDGLADVWSAPIVFGTKGGASSGGSIWPTGRARSSSTPPK